MNAERIIAIYDELAQSEFHWLEAEIIVRLERYLACFNYMARSPSPADDLEYDAVVNEMTEKYNLPRGLWDEGFNDTEIGRGFIANARPLIKKWVSGTMTPEEWGSLSARLDEDLDTDMMFFLYGIPHQEKPKEVDLIRHAEHFAQRNRK